MRVNPDRSADLLAALDLAQQSQQIALLQLSSGKRVNFPSDDPAAAAAEVLNQGQAAQNDDFQRSAASVRALLDTADSTISSVILGLQRAMTLGIEGANGTLSDAERAALAQEVQGVKDQILGLANLSFHGSFVFAGTASQSPPFVLDPASPSGITYKGNSGVNAVAVGRGLSVQVNLPGSQLFNLAFQGLQDLITALQTNSGIEAAVGSVRVGFDNITQQRVFYGNGMNQLDSQSIFLQGEKLSLAQRENDLVGADLAATATKLARSETGLTAVLSAASKISQLSLFDFLR